MSKTRGYLYNIKADMNFRCHNCGASMTFSNFLKVMDPAVHKQYVFERFKDSNTGRGTVVEEPKFNFTAPEFKTKIDLPKASENPDAKNIWSIEILIQINSIMRISLRSLQIHLNILSMI